MSDPNEFLPRVDQFDGGMEPITADELEELQAFLVKHHPPIAEELVEMHKQGLLPRLPMYQRLLFDDMRRFQAGKQTRHVAFLPD